MKKAILVLAIGTLGVGSARAGEAGGKVAARVGDERITVEEIDRIAMGKNLKMYQTLYTVRRQALERRIGDILLGKEAAARGVTVEELEEKEISGKVVPVTDDDLLNFYNQNQSRMGGRSFDLVRDQIRTFLEGRNELQARSDFIDGLKEKAAVRITLDPPRLEIVVADTEPAKGPAGAPITIVEYSDFQ